jgi:hypothetical protein
LAIVALHLCGCEQQRSTASPPPSTAAVAPPAPPPPAPTPISEEAWSFKARYGLTHGFLRTFKTGLPIKLGKKYTLKMVGKRMVAALTGSTAKGARVTVNGHDIKVSRTGAFEIRYESAPTMWLANDFLFRIVAKKGNSLGEVEWHCQARAPSREEHLLAKRQARARMREERRAARERKAEERRQRREPRAEARRSTARYWRCAQVSYACAELNGLYDEVCKRMGECPEPECDEDMCPKMLMLFKLKGAGY